MCVPACVCVRVCVRLCVYNSSFANHAAYIVYTCAYNSLVAFNCYISCLSLHTVSSIVCSPCSPRLMLLDGESHPPSPSKRMRTLDDMPLGIDITDISAYSVQSVGAHNNTCNYTRVIYYNNTGVSCIEAMFWRMMRVTVHEHNAQKQEYFCSMITLELHVQ